MSYTAHHISYGKVGLMRIRLTCFIRYVVFHIILSLGWLIKDVVDAGEGPEGANRLGGGDATSILPRRVSLNVQADTHDG